MSIISLPRHHTKRRSAAEASIPVASPVRRNPIADLTQAVMAVLDEPRYSQPVMRPTGVPAVKLGCRPGTSRTVLDELRADDKAWLPLSTGGLRVVPLKPSAVVDPLEQLFAMLDEAAPVTDWSAMLAEADQRVLDLLGAQDYRNARDFESELAAYDQSQRAVIDVQRALLDDIDMVGLDAVRVRQALAQLAEVSL